MGVERNETVVGGIVIEALPDTNFRVKLRSGEMVMVYLAGRMRLHRIRVLVGDSVEIKLDEFGKRGRIVKRL